MNTIEQFRIDIANYFDPDGLLENSHEIIFSPDSKYRLNTSEYRQTKADVNWNLVKVEVYDSESSKSLFNFFASERFFHCWLTVDEIDYLICAEDLCGGQTVIDLTNKQMSSFTDDTDGFIWAEFFPSPECKTLAIIGCVWACPYEIKVYDFSDPMALPLKEIKSIDVIGSETITGWVDNRCFKTCGAETEYVEEILADGNVRFNEVGKKVVERTICVDA